jgi:hypothetical protein
MVVDSARLREIDVWRRQTEQEARAAREKLVSEDFILFAILNKIAKFRQSA